MAIIIKNNSGSLKIYAGQEIADGNSYSIQSIEKHKWASDDALLADIALGLVQINDGTNDIVGTSNQMTYLQLGNLSPKDTDGAVLQRVKASKQGWTYAALPFEFKTAQYGSLYSKLADSTERSGISIKIYKADGSEITTSEDELLATKTVISFEPPYDYEIIGGDIRQKTVPTVDMRIWVIGAPDIPAQYGGSKEMIGGLNLSYIGASGRIAIDGRVTKYMQYNSNDHRSKMQYIVKYPEGYQHDILITCEMYRQ